MDLACPSLSQSFSDQSSQSAPCLFLSIYLQDALAEDARPTLLHKARLIHDHATQVRIAFLEEEEQEEEENNQEEGGGEIGGGTKRRNVIGKVPYYLRARVLNGDALPSTTIGGGYCLPSPLDENPLQQDDNGDQRQDDKKDPPPHRHHHDDASLVRKESLVEIQKEGEVALVTSIKKNTNNRKKEKREMMRRIKLKVKEEEEKQRQRRRQQEQKRSSSSSSAVGASLSNEDVAAVLSHVIEGGMNDDVYSSLMDMMMATWSPLRCDSS